MKAYYAYLRNDDDAGGEIIFANTVQEARTKAWGMDFTAFADSFIELAARRDKRYDGMEKLPAAELALHQWHDGWRWFDMDYPDPDTATDAEFIEWYNNNF